MGEVHSVLIQAQRIVRIWLSHCWFRSSGILLTHRHFPQLSSSRPRRRRAVHFLRLFTGECESSRLLFWGCWEIVEGLFRRRSFCFCGLTVAGGCVWGPTSGKNTGKSGRETKNAGSGHSRRFGVWCWGLFFRRKTRSSPSLSQLDSGFTERGTLQYKRLRRSPQISIHPWGAGFPEKPKPKPAAKERPDGMKLARHFQALLDSGKFENRAALARHLGVSRARVTQVLSRLRTG